MADSAGTRTPGYAREKTGIGAHLDIAMFDCLFSILTTGLATYLGTGQTPQRLGNRTSLAAPFGFFETRSGELAVCAADDHSFGKRCGAIGKPELLTDPRFADNVSRVVNVTALTTVLEQAFSARTAVDWVEPLHAGAMRMPGNPIKFRGRDDSGERSPGNGPPLCCSPTRSCRPS
jgi:CoA:oxalate CoA-transferase